MRHSSIFIYMIINYSSALAQGRQPMLYSPNYSEEALHEIA